MRRIVSVLLVALMVVMLCSCQGATNAFIGKWSATKVETSDGYVIDFSALENAIEEKFDNEESIEMSITFDNDNTYVMEYYVNGKQGNNYPKSGTYEVVDEKTLCLDGEDSVVLQDDGTMIGTFDDGEVKQYYKKAEK